MMLFLAPMAGVTNSIFRRLCQEQGAEILTTEFVSAEGIMHRNPRTIEYLSFDPSERPLGVQLFGADPERLAEAAKKVVDWINPNFIDLNFGCPVNKVVCKHGGSALLKNGPLLQQVARAVVKAVAPLPVTAKIRIGWDEHSINALTIARLLEEVGVERLTIHGRTRSQGYSGKANWDIIEAVAAAVCLPVIGNGDITSVQEALAAAQRGVAGLMIGRAAMAQPWIFGQIKAALLGQPISPSPSLQERLGFIHRHCREEITYRGDELQAMTRMRARLMAYTKGLEEGGVRPLRQKLSRVRSLMELEDLFAQWSQQ